jgi:hypothetical protein
VETRAAFSRDTPPHLGGRVSGSALEPFCRFKNFIREDRPRKGDAMNRPNEYRARGFELLSLAETMNDPERRADILRYARLWISLTEPNPDLPLRLPYELPPQVPFPVWQFRWRDATVQDLSNPLLKNLLCPTFKEEEARRLLLTSGLTSPRS